MRGKCRLGRLERLAKSARLRAVIESVRCRVLLGTLAEAQASRRDADASLRLVDLNRDRLTRLLCISGPAGRESGGWIAQTERIEFMRAKRAALVQARDGLEAELEAHQRLIDQTSEVYRQTGARRDAAVKVQKSADGLVRELRRAVEELSDDTAAGAQAGR